MTSRVRQFNSEDKRAHKVKQSPQNGLALSDLRAMFKFRSSIVNKLLSHAKINSDLIESEAEQQPQHEVIISDKRPLTLRRPSTALLASKRKQIQSMLIRLKKANLEVLLSAVETGNPGQCVLIPTTHSTLAPHLLLAQVFRWPDLQFEWELKRLSFYCQTQDCHLKSTQNDLDFRLYECCNPYHWTRILKPPHQHSTLTGKHFYKNSIRLAFSIKNVSGLDGAKTRDLRLLSLCTLETTLATMRRRLETYKSLCEQAI